MKPIAVRYCSFSQSPPEAKLPEKVDGCVAVKVKELLIMESAERSHCPSWKMVHVANNILVIFILSSTILMVETLALSKENRNLSLSKHGSTATRRLSSMIKKLGEWIPLDVQILYNTKHTEILGELSAQLYPEVNGLMIIEAAKSPLLLGQMLTSARRTTLLLFLCNGEDATHIFRMIRTHRLDSHLVTWLLILEEIGEVSDLLHFLAKFLFEGTRVSVATEEPNGSWGIWTSLVDRKGNIGFKQGSWNSTSKRPLDIFPRPGDEYFYDDMHGRRLTGVCFNLSIAIGFGRTYPDGSVEPVIGLDFDILKYLSRHLNFTYKILPQLDSIFGNPLPNGTVTGLVGKVARREADFALCALAINALRENAIDFTFPYEHSYLTIFSRAPKLKNRALASLSPFQQEVWMCIIISTLAMGPLMYGLSKCIGENTLGLEVYSFNVFRNIVNQGYELTLRHWTQRFLLYSWVLFCFVVAALYSGTLTAVLALPAYEKPVDSLYELPRAVKEGFTIGITRDSSHEYIFRSAEDGIYKNTWDLFNHKERSKSFISGDVEAIRKILSEKFVYIGAEVMFSLLTSSMAPRTFHVARDKFFPISAGGIVPSGAPYRKSFNKALQKVTELGLFLKWKGDFYRRAGSKAKDHKNVDGESNRRVITLTHLQAAFYIIGFGYLVSSIILIVELMLESRKNIFGF